MSGATIVIPNAAAEYTSRGKEIFIPNLYLDLRFISWVAAKLQGRIKQIVFS